MEPWQKLMTTANDSTVDADTAEKVSDNDYQRKTLSLYTMTKSLTKHYRSGMMSNTKLSIS